MSIDLDTVLGALASWNAISALVGLVVFFWALVRGKVSMAWMKRHFVDHK
jgi:hypothetical protein